MNLLERLRSLRDALPPGGSVTFTRADIDELLAGEGPLEGTTAPVADYTVEQLAEVTGKAPQTVRGWIRTGRLEAYLFRGREYRVTPVAWAAFLEAERRSSTGGANQARSDVRPADAAPDLSGWRRHYRKAS